MLVICDKDNTLVETISGKTFLSYLDQKPLPGVKEKITEHKANGDIIVVASNQGGIPKYKSLDSVISEFYELMTLLPEVEACYFCPDFGGSSCVVVNEKEVNFVAYHSNKYPPMPKMYFDLIGRNERKWKKYSVLSGKFRKPSAGMLMLAIMEHFPEAFRKETFDGNVMYVGDRQEDKEAAELIGVPYQSFHDWVLFS